MLRALDLDRLFTLSNILSRVRVSLSDGSQAARTRMSSRRAPYLRDFVVTRAGIEPATL